MDPEVATRKASTRSPILSLVDREYLKSTANIPRSAWEPISYLYSEADKAVERVKAMEVPGCNGPDSCKPRDEEGATAPVKNSHPFAPSLVVHSAECLEWVRAKTLKNWTQMLGWLDELLQGSQSVEALRSWQMMTGLQGQQQGQPRPSAAVMPDFPQPTPPGTTKPKSGMMRK